ncbi:molybdate ABC transporter substrate-binding protein [Streptomyces sp. HUAS MG47]|uniref:molybdate ABC transporter substrate-binding protein n=1 Tax=Streptomyces solicamelliae TaxID=3231716 RepID=UPI0038780C6D
MTGCGQADAGGGHHDTTVTVFAAASLTGVLEDAKDEFAKSHPGMEIRLNLGSSSTLLTQLRNGAPGDVFASADERTMQDAAKAGLTDGEPRVFARNTLSLLVRKGNPDKIKGLNDLSRPDLTVSLCGPQVPVGRYARQALAKAGVRASDGGQELDVKQVVSRVTMGEADVGIVYRTDALAAKGKADGIAIPDAQNVEARYPVGVLKGGNTEGARMFTDFLLSEDGRRILTDHGFLAPQ